MCFPSCGMCMECWRCRPNEYPNPNSHYDYDDDETEYKSDQKPRRLKRKERGQEKTRRTAAIKGVCLCCGRWFTPQASLSFFCSFNCLMKREKLEEKRKWRSLVCDICGGGRI